MPQKIETRCDKIDWVNMAEEVLTKLTYLRLAWTASERDCEPELHRKMVEDLYLPVITMLGSFCACIEDDGTGAPIVNPQAGAAL